MVFNAPMGMGYPYGQYGMYGQYGQQYGQNNMPGQYGVNPPVISGTSPSPFVEETKHSVGKNNGNNDYKMVMWTALGVCAATVAALVIKGKNIKSLVKSSEKILKNKKAPTTTLETKIASEVQVQKEAPMKQLLASNPSSKIGRLEANVNRNLKKNPQVSSEGNPIALSEKARIPETKAVTSNGEKLEIVEKTLEDGRKIISEKDPVSGEILKNSILRKDGTLQRIEKYNPESENIKYEFHYYANGKTIEKVIDRDLTSGYKTREALYRTNDTLEEITKWNSENGSHLNTTYYNKKGKVAIGRTETNNETGVETHIAYRKDGKTPKAIYENEIKTENFIRETEFAKNGRKSSVSERNHENNTDTKTYFQKDGVTPKRIDTEDKNGHFTNANILNKDGKTKELLVYRPQNGEIMKKTKFRGDESVRFVSEKVSDSSFPKMTWFKKDGKTPRSFNPFKTSPLKRLQNYLNGKLFNQKKEMPELGKLNLANKTLQKAKMKESGLSKHTEIKNTSIHRTTGKAPTNEQINTTMKNIKTQNADNQSKRLVEKHIDDAPSSEQQANYNKITYKAPNVDQSKIIENINAKANASKEINGQIGNNISDKNTIYKLEALKKTI